jgi:hypothetical protein
MTEAPQSNSPHECVGITCDGQYVLSRDDGTNESGTGLLEYLAEQVFALMPRSYVSECALCGKSPAVKDLVVRQTVEARNSTRLPFITSYNLCHLCARSVEIVDLGSAIVTGTLLFGLSIGLLIVVVLAMIWSWLATVGWFFILIFSLVVGSLVKRAGLSKLRSAATISLPTSSRSQTAIAAHLLWTRVGNREAFRCNNVSWRLTNLGVSNREHR